MFRGFFSRSVLLSITPVGHAAQSYKNETSKRAIFRPQELPIYETIFGDEVKTLSETESYIVRSSIESGVRVARECCCDCAQAIKDKKKPIDEFVSTGIEHSQFAFDYLNQPANGIHRTGAIATGAIAGYIIAIRRGFFRRFMSTSIGGFGIASICYPKEAEIYWKQALGETKTYATILYNFAYGVKPGDESKALPNLVPVNLAELYGNIRNFFVSGK